MKKSKNGVKIQGQTSFEIRKKNQWRYFLSSINISLLQKSSFVEAIGFFSMKSHKNIEEDINDSSFWNWGRKKGWKDKTSQ